MGITNINDDRFRRALAEEMPGLSTMIDGGTDMLNLRFTFQVKGGTEMFVTTEDAYEQVKFLAERVRQDALVKTGAYRIVRAANDQAEQYRQDNIRLSRMVQDRDDEIRSLEARIVDLQDRNGEDL